MKPASGIQNCLKEATDRMPMWFPDEYRYNRQAASGRGGDRYNRLQRIEEVSDSPTEGMIDGRYD
jgi:hypothetical protein